MIVMFEPAEKDLGRSFWPQVIPALAILFAATFTLDERWLRFLIWALVGVSLVVLILFLVLVHHVSVWQSLKEAGIGIALMIAFGALLSSVLLLVAVKSADPVLDPYDAWSRALVWFAFIVWGLAIALRLAGFALTRMRWVVVVAIGALI